MPEKLDLSRMTLSTMATRDHAAARHGLRRCLEAATFAEVRFYTDRAEWLDEGWIHRPTAPFPDPGEPGLSAWFLRDFMRDADQFAEHVLFCHWDGFIVNPSAWRDEWLEFDYIGAPWPDGIVGNSGFCLMSRRFCQAVRDLNIPIEMCFPGDVAICRHRWQRRHYPYRAILESQGMRYAPASVARLFSVENEPYVGSFGFHGTNTLVSVARQGLF